MKLARALEIAGKARIRRRIAAPRDAASERVAPSSERPVALRDTRGRYLKGWAAWSGAARRAEGAIRRRPVRGLEAAWSAGAPTSLSRRPGHISAPHDWLGAEDAIR